MEKLSRRSFFRLAGGGIAAAVIAPKLLLDKVIELPVEFGWTWHIDKAKIPSNLSEIITSTLRNNTQKLAENITANNSLLLKLKSGEKVNLKIEKISIEEQNKRMVDRLELRHKEKQAKRLRDKINNGGRLYPVDYKANPFYDGWENIEKRFS